VFGATAYSHIPPEKRKNLDPHAKKCIMVGYGESSGVKGYKLYDPIIGKFIFNRSATFDEEVLFAHMNKSDDFQNNLVSQNKLNTSKGERKHTSTNLRSTTQQSSQNQELGLSIIWRPAASKTAPSSISHITTQSASTTSTSIAETRGKSDENILRFDYFLQPATSIIET
jgi:hypothetical protein